MEVLEFTTNPFRGAVVNPIMLPSDPGEFRLSLQQSLEHWRQQALLTVWLEVPISKSALSRLAVAFAHQQQLVGVVQYYPPGADVVGGEGRNEGVVLKFVSQ